MKEKRKEDKRFTKEFNYLKFEGKYYDIAEIDGKPVIISVPTKEVKAKIEKAEKMSKVLEEKLNRKAVLMESIMNLDDAEFDKLYKVLFLNKTKPRPRTREGHCVDMKVGGFILPIN